MIPQPPSLSCSAAYLDGMEHNSQRSCLDVAVALLELRDMRGSSLPAN